MRNSFFLIHLAAAAIITLIIGLIYTSVQQAHRSGANDPQLQLTRDIAADLKRHHSTRLLPKDTVEISESLAPFVALYNNNGEPVQSTGLLDGDLPRIPKGVLDFTRKNGEDVLSWQPRQGVRMALVVRSVQSAGVAFVASGRSLLEVEKREKNLIQMVTACWLACLGVIVLHWVISLRFRKKAIQ